MNFHGLSLRDLEYVDAVAKHGHFGKAAQACAVSQPALSTQVRKVEDALGTELFERGKRRVTVSRDGEALLEQIRMILSEAGVLFDLAERALRPLSSTFRLGAINTVGPYYFPHILNPIRDAFPNLDLQLREGMTEVLTERLLAADLDALILATPVEDPSLISEPLFFEPFQMIVPVDHPYASGELLEPDTIDIDGLILLEEGHCLRDQTLDICGMASERGDTVHATGLETLRYMVAASNGWSLMPSMAVPSVGDPSLGGLVVYRGFKDSPPGRTISLAWRRRSPRQAEYRELLAFLRAHIPDGVMPITG